MKAARFVAPALAAFMAALCSGACAQATTYPAQNRAAAASAQQSQRLGAQLAQQGAPKIAACARCHGAHGEGNAAAGFPRIAGQSQNYLARQLLAYANGARQNPVLSPIAKSRNDSQRQAVSGFYAQLTGAAGAGTKGTGTRGAGTASATGMTATTATTTAPVGSVVAAASAAQGQQRGERLARVGDESQRVQACANCHGVGGIGLAPAYPYLAGQHAGYLVTALGEWKSGARKTDPSDQMVLIAQSLNDADMRALAAYYAGMPAPSPRDADVATGWRPAPRGTAVVSGPRGVAGAQQQTQGVGSEQGAPLSGAQGQGSGGASGGGSQGSPTGDSQTGTGVGPAASAPR